MKKSHPSDDLYTKQYQEKWLLKDKHQQAKYLLQKVGDSLKKHPGNLLDVGCGVGIWAASVKNTLGFEVTGLDINDQAVAKSSLIGIKTIKTDIENRWPLTSGSFSVVSVIQVLEHVLNPDFLLEEAHRVLSPNGILLITTPNLAAWFNRLLLLAGYQPFFLEASTKDKTAGLSFTRRMTSLREPVGHIRVFTLSALKDLLEINGFTPEMVTGTPIEYLPSFLKPFDWAFSKFPALASDLIVIAKKKHDN